MRWAEKEKKKISSRIPFILGPSKKIVKKNRKKIKKLKNLFWQYFQPSRDVISRKSEKKKFLLPNSVHIRPGQENSEKNRKKKVKKIKKPLSGIIFSENWDR